MKKCKLSDIGDIVTGKTPKTKIKENYGDKYFFITPQDLANDFIVQKTNRYLSEKGFKEVKSNSLNGLSVCIDCIGSNLGNVIMVNEMCVTNQQINSITNFREEVNPYYIYFYFKNKKEYLQTIAGGTSVPIINKTRFSNIEIFLPSKKEQDKIANKLKVLEDKILNNNTLITNIYEYMQLVYLKSFYSYRDSETPYEFKYISLNELVDIITENEKPYENPKKIYKHYSVPVFDNTKSYGQELGETILSNKYKVNSKNLLVCKLNPWFKRVVYPLNVKEAICSTEFVVWQPKKDNILEFLYVVANSEHFTTYCTNASSGTSNSHKRVNPEFMMKYKVPYNEEIVCNFNKMLKPMVQKIHLLLIENKNLKEVRDLLIKKLIQ